jgi:hypothetical protein
MLFAIWWASSVIVLVVYFLIVLSMSRSVYRVTRTPAFNISVKPNKRRAPRKKQKPFQPSFNAPASRPDPGWDFDASPPEPPARAPIRKTEPGWELGPPSFEPREEATDAIEPPRKKRSKESVSAPENAPSEDDKWGRL